jgi:NAD(P)-dependent dehydrogenase (short-subunit alcohol dehydrogenase family)
MRGGPPDYGGRYRGKVAVVTGASSGLGARLALDLSRAGAEVTAVARRADRLAEVEDQLRAHSGASRALVCDVGDEVALGALLAGIEKESGRIDLLVNNAGMDPGVRLADIELEDFQRTFDVNFFAAVAGTLAVLPGMFQRGEGAVVNVSSDGGRLPSPGPGAYPSSKAALSAFSESVSFRAERHGVHMHVVYPAWMPTELGTGAIERGLRRPPRLTRRSEAQVSARVLSQIGRSPVDISVSRLIDGAVVFRAVAPRLYHRFRRGW